MAHLTTASYIAYNLAASEAYALNNEFIEIDHMFLGICKTEDLLTWDYQKIPNLSEDEWDRAKSEISRWYIEFHRFRL